MKRYPVDGPSVVRTAALFAFLVWLAVSIAALFGGEATALGRFLDETFGLGFVDQLIQDHASGVQSIIYKLTGH